MLSCIAASRISPLRDAVSALRKPGVSIHGHPWRVRSAHALKTRLSPSTRKRWHWIRSGRTRCITSGWYTNTVVRGESRSSTEGARLTAGRSWNLAIAATALQDWETARDVWQDLKIFSEPGEGRSMLISGPPRFY
jgi:hypothetical protein